MYDHLGCGMTSGGEGYYGVIEVAGSDTDGDGLLDTSIRIRRTP